MTTVTEANRKTSARSFAGVARRAPLTVAFSKLPGVTLTGTGDGNSVNSVPGKNGIDDGYTGSVRAPWYAYSFATRAYSSPFGTVTPKQIEQGTITVDGETRIILNAKLNAIKTILEIKIGGISDE